MEIHGPFEVRTWIMYNGQDLIALGSNPQRWGMLIKSTHSRCFSLEKKPQKWTKSTVYTVLYIVQCTLGWVNLYKKFEIEKCTVGGKLILPKKWKGILVNLFLGTTGLRICMDLRIFASFLSPTILKICSQKFDRK